MGPASRQATIVELDAVQRRAGVEDPVDPSVEVGEHMVGRRRADMARPIGRGRGERPTSGLDQGAGDRMVRRPQGQRIEPRPCEQADPAGGGGRRNQSERSWPESARQSLGGAVQPGVLKRVFDPEHMGD